VRCGFLVAQLPPKTDPLVGYDQELTYRDELNSVDIGTVLFILCFLGFLAVQIRKANKSEGASIKIRKSSYPHLFPGHRGRMRRRRHHKRRNKPPKAEEQDGMPGD
jgi:hypothetical protein